MQAQNASERKKSKKRRQYPTPPTGSKASRFGITKEFINFLLDHDEDNLFASTHGSQKKDTDMTARFRACATTGAGLLPWMPHSRSRCPPERVEVPPERVSQFRL